MCILFKCVFKYFCNCDIYKVLVINDISNKWLYKTEYQNYYACLLKWEKSIKTSTQQSLFILAFAIFQKKTMRKKIVVAAYILCCEKLLSSPVRVIGSHVYRLIVS